MVVAKAGSSSSEINFYKEIIVDATSGSFAGFTCFIFEGLKKRFQRGELNSHDVTNWKNGKLFAALHPKEAFRGAMPFSVSVALNATAGLTTIKLIRSLPFYDDSSELHKLSSAVSGGLVGAMIASAPVENTIVVQQEHKLGPIQAWKHMLNEGIGRPWVGVRELMLREAGFIGSVSYFGQKAQDVVFEKTKSQSLSTISAIGVGATFATITHPFDTVATWRQKRGGKITLLGGVKELYSLGGKKAFFKGLYSRIFLFTGCYLILSKLPTYIIKALRKFDEWFLLNFVA